MFLNILTQKSPSQFTTQPTLFIPTPMNAMKQRLRGFSQSAIIAKHLAKITGNHHNSHLLTRNFRLRSQASLDVHQRYRNIKNSMRCKNPKKITNQRIIIVDDVITSGSTVYEVIKTITPHAPASIAVLAVLHGNNLDFW
jgi:predicted amidophosphoribosyltransferase